jgi:glutathione S-transferase
MNLELVSFALCPYVQRSVITLNYKKAQYKVTYIDLKNKPQWFLDISPLGKVPVLRVDNKTTIFESAVINEFIDETVGTPLMPQEPLQRALERAWIQFGSDILMTMYMMTMARDKADLETKMNKFFTDIGKVQTVLKEGPYFRGSQFSLVDTSWAPVFTRAFLSPKIKEDKRWNEMSKIRAWGEALLGMPAVKESVPVDFAEQYVKSARDNGSLLF